MLNANGPHATANQGDVGRLSRDFMRSNEDRVTPIATTQKRVSHLRPGVNVQHTQIPTEGSRRLNHDLCNDFRIYQDTSEHVSEYSLHLPPEECGADWQSVLPQFLTRNNGTRPAQANDFNDQTQREFKSRRQTVDNERGRSDTYHNETYHNETFRTKRFSVNSTICWEVVHMIGICSTDRPSSILNN